MLDPPSQKTQSQDVRKQVVVTGLSHLLQWTIARDDDLTEGVPGLALRCIELAMVRSGEQFIAAMVVQNATLGYR